MKKFLKALKLIEEDWIRYPFKKLNILFELEVRIKNKIHLTFFRDERKISNQLSSYTVGISLILIALSGLCQSFTYQFWFRLASLKGILGFIAKFKHRHLCKKYGVYIPRGTSIGGGLIIWHCVGIVINPKAKIGDNCDIFQFVSIGEHNKGNASIGNNVFIGPNVSIVGKVSIGNNSRIGAGTVVINDIPENCTSVGNPNRIISKEY